MRQAIRALAKWLRAPKRQLQQRAIAKMNLIVNQRQSWNITPKRSILTV